MPAENIEERSLEAGLRWFGTASKRCLIVLPSHGCFCVPISQRTSRRAEESLVFDLENEVPIDAESMSFALLESQASRLALVANGRLIKDRLSKDQLLEGYQYLAMVPELILALNTCPLPKDASGVVLIVGAAACDVVEIQAGIVHDWKWRSNASETIDELLGRGQNDAVIPNLLSVIIDREEGDKPTFLAGIPEDRLIWRENNWLTSRAADILEGREAPPSNLANGPLRFVDPLAPIRSAKFVFASACVMLLALVAGGMFWRARQYQVQAALATTEQEQVYARLFPKQAIPVGMMSRVESEYRRLAATKDQTLVPRLGSSLPVMQAFWEAIPVSDARFNFSVIHIMPDRIEDLQGMSKGYADQEMLRTSMVASGFEIPPVSATLTSSGATLHWKAVEWHAIPDSGDQP